MREENHEDWKELMRLLVFGEGRVELAGKSNRSYKAIVLTNGSRKFAG